MRIYNNKNCQISLPMLGTTQKLELGPKSVSGNILPTVEFLKLITQSFTIEEIAIIVAGSFEYNVIANIPLAPNFTVGSLDEAIERFAEKKEETPIEILEKTEAVEDAVAAEPIEDKTPAEEEEVVEEKPATETKKKRTSKKSAE